MIICVTANMESGINAATTRESRFATATPGAASQTYFITGGMFFSARRRSAHLGLGISSAGLASLRVGLPTKALVLTTGSPISSVAASCNHHVQRRDSLSGSACLLPTLIPCNLLISKDLRNWPKSCSAIFFVVTESSTRICSRRNVSRFRQRERSERSRFPEPVHPPLRIPEKPDLRDAA